MELNMTEGKKAPPFLSVTIYQEMQYRNVVSKTGMTGYV